MWREPLLLNYAPDPLTELEGATYRLVVHTGGGKTWDIPPKAIPPPPPPKNFITKMNCNTLQQLQ